MEKIFDIAKDSEKSWGVIAQGIDGNFEAVFLKIFDKKEETTIYADIDGYIALSTGAIVSSSPWMHTQLIPVENFVSAEGFVAHAAVANIAYYTDAVISVLTFVGYDSSNNKKYTSSDVSAYVAEHPSAKYMVLSTNTTTTFSANIYQVTEAGLISRVETIDNSLSTINAEIDDIKKRSTIVSPKMMHFSFDDTISALYDLTYRNKVSIFDNSFFNILKNMHDIYGCVFSCYCFFHILDADESTVLYSLSDVADTWASEFADNSSWLKFGFHSRNNYFNYGSATKEDAEEDYAEFCSQIYRITGTYDCLDLCPRLQNFAGNLVSCQALRDSNCGCVGFLASDYSETGNTEGWHSGYYLSEDNAKTIWKKGQFYDYVNNLHFFGSSLRLDNITGVNVPAYMDKFETSDKYGQSHMIAMYAHENQFYSLDKDAIKNTDYKLRFENACIWAINHGYTFGYPMNRIIISV